MAATGRNNAVRRLWLILAAIALLSCLGFVFLRANEPSVPELRIGVLAPLTGTSLRMGVTVRALNDMESRINAAGGVEVGGKRHQLRLLVRDTGDGVERAMSEVGLLIRQEKVSALIGPYFSRIALPVSQVAEAAHVPLLSPTASAPELTQGRRYVFRSCLTNAAQSQAMAAFALSELRQRRAAVLFDAADPYSSNLASEFLHEFAQDGGEAVAFQYTMGQADFGVQMHNVLKSRAGVLYLPNFPSDVIRQMRQARAAGFRGVFLGADGWDSDRLFLTQPEAQGSFFTADYAPDGLDEKGEAETSGYAQRLGEPLDKEATLTVDALGMLLAAVQSAGAVNPESIRDALAELRHYEGITGRVSFNGQGDAERDVHILGLAGGKARLRQISSQRAKR